MSGTVGRNSALLLFSLLLAALLVSASTLFASPANAAVVTVSGTVTGDTANGPQPLANVKVQIFSTRGDDATYVSQATTNASGQYTLSNVTTSSSYRLFFLPQNDTHASEWLGNTPHERDSSLLVVGTTNVTGKNAELPLGGSISGTITTTPSTDTAVATAFLWDETEARFERTSYADVTSGGLYDINGLPSGEYLLKFSYESQVSNTAAEYWNHSPLTWDADPIEVTGAEQLTGYDTNLKKVPMRVDRIAGANRYEGSAALSRAAFNSADIVFIANGDNFPDGLSAGPAATALNAPILLVSPGIAQQAILDEVQRLNPSTVVVLGGEDSVSTAVANAVGAAATPDATIHRVTGADRFESSREIARFAFDGLDVSTAYITTGYNFPDGITGGAAASNEGGPIILDSGSGTLDPATITLLNDLDVERVVIVAGTAAIPASTETALAQVASVNSVHRITGVDRYDSSVRINKNSFRFADTVFLTVGTNFPDGLSVGGVAGSWGAPVYLVQAHCVPVAVLAELDRLAPRRVIVLGGPNSLGFPVEDLVSC